MSKSLLPDLIQNAVQSAATDELKNIELNYYKPMAQIESENTFDHFQTASAKVQKDHNLPKLKFFKN